MPIPPNVHYATIEKNIPAWLKRSSESLHRELRNWQQAPAWLAAAIERQPDVARAWSEEHARHREHQADVQQLFAHLPDLETYARKALTDAINERFKPESPIDVDNTYLIDARLIDINNAIHSRQAVDRATRSLLHCALHNFDADAAAEHGMDAPETLLKKSVIVDYRRFMGTVPIINRVDITAEAFADLCRNLDIGARYHDLVHAIYYPAATAGRSADDAALDVYLTLGRAEVSAFRQSLHFARLKGDIDKDFYEAALAVPLDKAPTANTTITFSTLSLWEAELSGIVLVTREANGQKTQALYNAQDDETPIKTFSSIDMLEKELSDRLRANIDYLDPHIADRDKASVQYRLADRLTPIQWSTRGLHERVPDPHTSLYPVSRPFSHAFQGMMAFKKAERHEKDALYHAVPTEIVDRRTAQAHRELIFGRVLTGLNIAGFFVPGLGQFMLAVCVTQLAFEVYDGIEAWHNDERDTAFNYLVDVIENIAIMAALTAAHQALKGIKGETSGPAEELEVERIPVETPSFIEELEEVEMPDGQTRLWKPDLTPYRSNQALPNGLEPDERGLRQHQGKQWLVVEGQQYQVEQTPATGEYRLRHPSTPHRYQPLLRHNGAGAWLLPGEQPQQWAGTALLRRLGHLSAHFDETTLQRILDISATHEDVIRRTLAENGRLPALLEDALQRFKLDQSIRQIPDSRAWPAAFARAYESLPIVQAPNGELIRRVYPGLPGPVIDELARSADAREQQELGSGKMPLRLAEEARIYLQQTRLARAYEGLFLASVRNWDSDCLILHTLQRLPHWPADTRLELRQRRFWPSQSASIGPLDARLQKTISSAEAGYIVHVDGPTDTPAPLYPNLPAALFTALPEAMTQLGVSGSTDLQHLLQRSPLLPRAALRAVLGMRPVRPGYRSPMRLADGRVGYPLSGGLPSTADISRQTLLDAVAATGLPEHTRRSAEQILLTLTSPGRTRLQVFERLQQLLEQRNELQSRLDEWREGIAPNSEQSTADHENLRNAIMQHWYETALDENGEHTAQLTLQRVPWVDVPMNLPQHFTAQVRRLHLLDPASGNLAGWSQHDRMLQRLLRQLPHLEELEISRPYNPRATPSPLLFSIATISQHLPGLRALALTNQNIALTATDLDLLAGMPQLRRLELRGNRFAQHNTPSLHELSLEYLGLDNMQLSQWPIGLGADALGRIAHVSMRNNNLRSLPTFLINDPDSALRHSLLSLEGNDINQDHLQRLLLNETRLASHVTVDHSPAVSERLARIRRERQQLREAIDGWAQASTSTTPLTQGMLEDRERIEAALNRFWENQERGLPYLRLQLEDIALQHFPSRLPAFFLERVNALTLSGVSGSTAQLGQLLERFPNITRLTIDAHMDATPSLASALRRLPQLAHLEFRNMGLEIDQVMLDTFGDLPRLTSLDLSGNRVGAITQAPAGLASSLTSLSLSNMGLQAWPAWCEGLLPLELLDLSTNNIAQLPDYILQNMENQMPISSIALFDNPLALDTIVRLRVYSESQHSFTFALDTNSLLLTDTSDDDSLLDHPHFPLASDDTPRVELWSLGNEAQNEALLDSWQTLQQQTDGDNLLRLAGRLRNAAPYVDPTSQAAFGERVRLMLVTAATHDELRPTMSAIAAEALPDPLTGAQTCHDGALQTFNNIELLMMSSRVLTDAGDSLEDMYRRLRQLYRMGQLELLANQRTAQGDHVSVRLAYRRELAAELDLPIADGMRFRGAAMLAPGELASVLEQVREREGSDAFVTYLLANDYWTDRLRAEYASRFDAITERFGERVQELSALDLPLHEELALQQGLHDDKQQQEIDLLQELTRLYIRHDRPARLTAGGGQPAASYRP